MSRNGPLSGAPKPITDADGTPKPRSFNFVGLGLFY